MVVLVALAAVLFAACGVTSDRRPRVVSAANVPFDLMAPSTTTTTTTPLPFIGDPVRVQVYLLGPSFRLEPVTRTVATPVSLGSVIDALLAGPSVGESAANYGSDITGQTRLLGATVTAGVAQINLSQDFLVGGQEQILAIAQLVYTATGVPGVTGVTFAIEGKPVEVPTQDGTTTGVPVTRKEYVRLALQ